MRCAAVAGHTALSAGGLKSKEPNYQDRRRLGPALAKDLFPLYHYLDTV
jgi:hypothetical protein